VHWAFEEGSGTTAVDSSGNNNDGTIAGGPIWQDGVVGKCLSFDGSDDQVGLGTGNNLPVDTNEPFSMNMWLHPTATLEYWTPIAGIGPAVAAGPSRHLANIVTLDFWCNHQNLFSSVWLYVNQWQMVTVTFDGTTVRIYRNTEQIGSKDMDILSVDPQVHIAWPGPHMASRFAGMVDEFTIWDGALTEREITYLHGVRAELSGDGAVDFKDFAIMANNWLEGPVLWP
jgi:hypothetical protein